MSDCYIARSRSVAARQLGDELIIMSATDSTLFNLSPVAAVIWQSADGKTPLANIVEQQICSAFEVEFAEAFRDAQEFVAGLASHGILFVADAPIPDASAVAPAPVPPSVSGQPIQGLSQPRITPVPYATSTLRYTATAKRAKKRFKGKRRRPHVSDILIVRQI